MLPILQNNLLLLFAVLDTFQQNTIENYLNAIHLLPQEAMSEFLSYWEVVDFKRNDFITFEGQTERYLYFVLEGIQRSFYIKDDKEHVIAFTYPPSFSGIPESFMTQTPSHYFLQTITASKMLRFYHAHLEELFDKHHALERLFRKAYEQVLIGLIQRQYEHLAFSIEERFRAFLRRSPHLLNQIPHKHLASYLGIDATNFSKLLHTIKV
ncbi:cAMP-binding domain of CRP or a regulatory subunit of cAMP-dependent protein kinases [Thermoflexibacter ruber]|uniref:cAMP-binding domain of CRP or a regulatory subunit of cAMP-dependent protein kinases n=1 Tax=Thermoflexibacter ruber TaxID=1003 RepID=A0A1I2ISF9_9BACT|nr:cAMP-binding domain of CRP or a regulatory subunit of cAMP-dependent protein kinases [Thermoflexibacter ruber]